MKSLRSILLESVTVDDIFYKIGKNIIKWKYKTDSKLRDLIQTKYNNNPGNKRLVLSYAKEKLFPILPDSKEVIHRSKWDLDGLIGETEYQLMHPHYYELNKWVEQYHKRTHDVLTIFECSNSKPYGISQIRNKIYEGVYNKFSDFACISNPGIVPTILSNFYPYRYDEWDHFAESPDIAKKYIYVCASRFIQFIKKMGYKKVIVVMQSLAPQECFKYMYNENIEGCRDWLYFVNDDEQLKKYKKLYLDQFNDNPGLLAQRLPVMPAFRDRYRKLLKQAIDKSQLEEFEKLEKMIVDEDKEGIKEFNGDYDIANLLMVGNENGDFEFEIKEDEKLYNKFVDFINDYLTKEHDGEDLHERRKVVTVLDLLMDYHKGNICPDPDHEYWQMHRAMKHTYKKVGYVKVCDHCYCSQEQLEEDKEAILKTINTHKLMLIDDDRRDNPDKFNL